MTLDELNANLALKHELAKAAAAGPLVPTIRSIFQTGYMQLGADGRTYGFSDVDKAERLGAIQGYNKAIRDFEAIFSEPRPVARDIPATYGAVPVNNKREKK